MDEAPDEKFSRLVRPHAKAIARAIEEAGHSQKTFAVFSRIGIRTIRKAMRGVSISRDTLQKIAEKLGKPYAELVLHEQGKSPDTSASLLDHHALLDRHAGYDLRLVIDVPSALQAKRAHDVLRMIQDALRLGNEVRIIRVESGSLFITLRMRYANAWKIAMEPRIQNLLLQQSITSVIIYPPSGSRDPITAIYLNPTFHLMRVEMPTHVSVFPNSAHHLEQADDIRFAYRYYFSLIHNYEFPDEPSAQALSESLRAHPTAVAAIRSLLFLSLPQPSSGWIDEFLKILLSDPAGIPGFYQKRLAFTRHAASVRRIPPTDGV